MWIVDIWPKIYLQGHRTQIDIRPTIFQDCMTLVKSQLFLESRDTAKLLQLKLIQIFARDILLMKKLEIEKTKPN